MFFFSRTTLIHIWLLPCNMLFVVYNCPGQQDPQISLQLNMYGTWWSGNLLFLQSLPQPSPNCDNGCKMLETVYCMMTFGTFMIVCMREYMPALPPEGDTLCIDVILWTTLTVTCVSYGLNLSYTPILINYLSHPFSVHWTCPWKSCIFFPAVYILEKYICILWNINLQE